ncbi:Transposase DDE domain-containing protein [Chryseobacterium taihuense]|uniref:Transposase DDE domain-containing protein n=1 Tax=Chryseobacterium taihuense TaxID=1141221 RepID=A0ABY0QSX5_9FLAO|nr:Transposase DDE domain-containing protein [Chryseobacterium taihuense]
MHEKLNHNKNYTRFLTKRRSSTVELVLGTLINHHSMKRINDRGMKAANKHVLMAALSYNLKKLLKFPVQKVKSKAQILEPSKSKVCASSESPQYVLHILELSVSKILKNFPIENAEPLLNGFKRGCILLMIF